MAKNKQQQATDEPIALDVQLSKGEAFIEKNWKKLAIVIGAIIVIVAGIYTYKHYMAGKEQEAQKAIVGAQTAFAQQQYEQALKGEGNTKGLLKIIEEYGGTETANIAKLYAGLAYAKTDKVDEAIKMLEDFTPQGDKGVSPQYIAALANCYAADGQLDKAVDTFKKAASEADNAATSPQYLIEAGLLLESQKKNDEALKIYEQIKKDYPQSALVAPQQMQGGYVSAIDKYIERVSK